MKRIVTLTGPSLSGKTTLMRRLQRRGGFQEIVSHTTRPIRTGETNHVDYHFVTNEEFAATEMVETVQFGDYRYGVARSSVEDALESDQVPIVILEPNGVEQFQTVASRYGWELFKVFVNISRQQQEERFLARMLADLENSWEPYRKRYALMKLEERWFSANKWDHVVSSFSEFNEDAAVQAILNLLHRPDLRVSTSRYGRAALADVSAAT
jgi:guanylate kinase